MSIELSRRDFMKCSAVAALAVASGTLLTGCGGGGGSTGVGLNTPVNLKGVTMVMNDLDCPARLGEYELVKVEFELNNKSETVQQIGTSAGNLVDNVLGVVGECIATGSPEPLKKLSNSRNFQVHAVDAEGKNVAVYAYVDVCDEILSNGKLAPGADADIVLYCAVDSDWQALTIDYKHLGGQRFVARN